MSRIKQQESKDIKGGKVKSEQNKDNQIQALNQHQIHRQKIQRNKVIEQNIKLKLQIHELTNQLDELLLNDKKRKQQFNELDAQKDASQTQNVMKDKMAKIKKQKLQITQLKNKIFSVKRQLENVYGNRNVLKKEQQLKSLKENIQKLQQERDSLLKIQQNRKTQLEDMKNEEKYAQKLDILKQQLAAVKQESKIVNQRVIEAQRILRKNHQQFIKKQQKVKELENRLNFLKQKSKSRRPIQTVTPEMVVKLQEEISHLQQQRRQTQKIWEDKIRTVDAEYSQKKVQQQRKLLILKEKQRQFKVNQLKIKQLRKLVRHNMAEKRSKQISQGQDMDMSQFRHKRNIKHLS